MSLRAPYRQALYVFTRYLCCAQHVAVGIVGGSNLVKIREQLGKDGTRVMFSKTPSPFLSHQHPASMVTATTLQLTLSDAASCAATTAFDYVFSENGLMAHQKGQLIGSQSFQRHLGEAKLKHLINFILHYIADLDIPIKRGRRIARMRSPDPVLTQTDVSASCDTTGRLRRKINLPLPS